MQLRNARLCLDCEEVHDAPQCPACASETFAFISRWVPAPERRARPRTPEPTSPETLETYRQMLTPEGQPSWKFVKRGAVGLALFGLAGWAWQRNRQEGRPAQQREGTTELAARKDRIDEERR